MMTKSPLMKFVGMAAWLVTSLAAVFTGLAVLGYDMYNKGFMLSMKTPILWVILVAGVLSLLMFVMALATGNCHCCGSECKPGPHNHPHTR